MPNVIYMLVIAGGFSLSIAGVYALAKPPERQWINTISEIQELGGTVQVWFFENGDTAVEIWADDASKTFDDDDLNMQVRSALWALKRHIKKRESDDG